MLGGFRWIAFLATVLFSRLFPCKFLTRDYANEGTTLRLCLSGVLCNRHLIFVLGEDVLSTLFITDELERVLSATGCNASTE